MSDEEIVKLITQIANNFGISCDDASYIIKSFENFGKEFMMSEADKMFNELGYKKFTSDDCIMYMKNLFMITFIIPNKNFITEYKQGDYNFPKIRPFEINMQELQAIIQKCKELRWIE